MSKIPVIFWFAEAFSSLINLNYIKTYFLIYSPEILEK